MRSVKPGAPPAAPHFKQRFLDGIVGLSVESPLVGMTDADDGRAVLEVAVGLASRPRRTLEGDVHGPETDVVLHVRVSLVVHNRWITHPGYRRASPPDDGVTVVIESASRVESGHKPPRALPFHRALQRCKSRLPDHIGRLVAFERLKRFYL